MEGKESKPTVRMEVICSLNFWIRSFQFGLPGVMNDLYPLKVSEHFVRVLSGIFLFLSQKCTVFGRILKKFSYLADGSHTSWRTFIKSLIPPTDQKTKLFCTTQETIGKYEKRVFGVLFRRIKIFFIDCDYWSIE